ncbi:MAG: hypothetical protein P1V51_05220 [Deltaproteobacteria bacterium]|nr:hypothetical protein [Deltaproteobacteria bacterium]
MRRFQRLLGRLLPLAALGVLLFTSTGCVFFYSANAAPPGRYVPPMEKGQGDFGVDIPLGRNPSYGVEVGADGEPEPDNDQPPMWLGLDLAFRYGLTDQIGLDARITTSFLVPFPFPMPNGFTLAPIFELLEKPEQGIALHLSPRGIWTNGVYISSGINDYRTETKVHAAGGELPVMFTYSPVEWFDLSGTAFFRAFYVFAERDDNTSSGAIQAKAHWPALGGGLTVAAILTAGRFRISLGAGLEAGPNLAANYTDADGEVSGDGAMVLYPQGGLTIGAGW